MLKSMTAFGRSSVETPFGRFFVEIKSLNRKFLDVSLSLPREFSCFETLIRNLVASKLFRGKVEVYIQASFDDKVPINVKPNLPLAREMKKAWEALAADLQVKEEFSLEFLKGESDILLIEKNTENEEGYKVSLKEAVKQALEDAFIMKIAEGKSLYNDIKSRLDLLSKIIKNIEKKSSDATEKFRDKLKERIGEYLEGTIENDERLMKEIALYAEKVDISEEIIRFNSHLSQFFTLMDANENSIGKKLEFLVQELLREVNTIGSKAQNSSVAHDVIALKGEIEKIREQIQNVE